MTSIRPRAWWILAFFGATFVLFGLTDLAAGATSDPGIALAIAGRTPLEIQADDPAGYRLYDFATRAVGLGLILMGALVTAIVIVPYRAGERWAWRLLWIVPAWAAAVPLLYLAFGLAPGQPPAPPMVSGPIVAVVAAAALLADRPRFVARAAGDPAIRDREPRPAGA